jgi:peptide/nickel transport system substrate-binding protein
MTRNLPAALLVLAACTAPAHCADLTIAVGTEVTSIDPHYVQVLPNNNIAEHVFDKLVHTDERQKLRPGLAQSWRPIDDLTWEFRLRRGVKFHDGSDFTAADVVFSLDRPKWLAALPKPPIGGYGVFTQAITEKIVVDPYTIRLKTAAAYPNLPNDMSGLPVVSSRAAKDAHGPSFDSGKAAVGTGPYRFVRFARGDRVELARNDQYWDARPAWDRVTFRMIVNDASRVATLLSGGVDMIDNIPTPDFAKLKAQPGFNVFTTVSNRLIHFQLDSARDKSPFITDKAGAALERNPLKDVRVRRALSMAINRPAIVERTMDGLAVPAGQLMPEGFFGLSPNLKVDAYDPDGARKLLAEAGYPDGFALTLHGPNNRYVNDDQLVQVVAQMLSRVGIGAKVQTMPMSIYAGRGSRHEYSVALLGWGVVTGEATFPLRALVATFNKDKQWGVWNWGGYSNPRADALLDQALATVDDPRREKLLQEATDLVIRDYAIIPLHFQVNTWAARKPLQYVPRTDERTYAHAVRVR